MRTRRQRRRRGGHDEDNADRWLLTYADMITLLLALFVVLFALSTINARKFLELKMGLTKTFSHTAVTQPSGTGLLRHTSLVSHAGDTPPKPNVAPSGSSTPSLDQIQHQVQQALAQQGLGADASVARSRQGVVVQVLADKAFFASGSADLGVVGDRVVDTIAQVIRSDPNGVEVEGYTDDQPIDSGVFTSNWQLSAIRAANVVQRLSSTDGIAPARLQSVGYGATRPVVPNTSAANRAQNRRVDVVILANAKGGS